MEEPTNTAPHKYLRRYLHHVEEDLNQNRRQKVVNIGALRLCRGEGLTFKFGKNSTYQFGGLGALFGGYSHQSPPVATGLT